MYILIQTLLFEIFIFWSYENLWNFWKLISFSLFWINLIIFFFDVF
jgi:hypothetical protein